MNDDQTRIRPFPAANPADDDRTQIAARHPALAVDVLDKHGTLLGHYRFPGAFKVGRAADNAIVVHHDAVSRHHLEIKPEFGIWWLHNLKSTNGVYIDGRLVQDKQALHGPVTIALGVEGIYLRLQPETPTQALTQAVAEDATLLESGPVVEAIAPRSKNVTQQDVEARLLAAEDTEDMGDYTLMVRRVIHQDRVKRGKSYEKVIWSLVAVFLVAVGLAAYQYIALDNAKKLAIDMFYDIKSLEVNLSQADIKLEQSAALLDSTLKTIDSEKMRILQEELKQQQLQLAAERQRMRQERERLAKMKAKYREYVKEANSLRLSFPTEEAYENELIAKVARELGESELEVPEEFRGEVRKYIQYWQKSSRLQTAMQTVEQNNWLPLITDMLEKYGLPLYFVYLPLQESNYNSQAIGPETRFGIAKGAWQLMAETAQQYGLKPGPLVAVPEFDDQDERFDFVKATQAGVKYLRQIYGTEAQASGLLVMASYNYGDTRVRTMINQLPDNPRERNFWTFLQKFELPAETRDYVFYIFSAAVIGEDPAHFGFKFNPPLYRQKS